MPIVVAAPKRLTQLPNVLTFAEVGLPSQPDVLACPPCGDAQAVVDKLNTAV
jgi:hypothetical protein